MLGTFIEEFRDAARTTARAHGGDAARLMAMVALAATGSVALACQPLGDNSYQCPVIEVPVSNPVTGAPFDTWCWGCNGSMTWVLRDEDGDSSSDDPPDQVLCPALQAAYDEAQCPMLMDGIQPLGYVVNGSFVPLYLMSVVSGANSNVNSGAVVGGMLDCFHMRSQGECEDRARTEALLQCEAPSEIQLWLGEAGDLGYVGTMAWSYVNQQINRCQSQDFFDFIEVVQGAHDTNLWYIRAAAINACGAIVAKGQDGQCPID